MQADICRAIASSYRQAYEELEKCIDAAKIQGGEDPLELIHWMEDSVAQCRSRLSRSSHQAQPPVAELIEIADRALGQLVDDLLVDVCRKPLVGKVVIVEEMIWKEASWLRYQSIWKSCYPQEKLHHPLWDRPLERAAVPYPAADLLIGWLDGLPREITPSEFLAQKAQLSDAKIADGDEEWLWSHTKEIQATSIVQQQVEELALEEIVESLQLDTQREVESLVLFAEGCQRSMAAHQERIEESFAEYYAELQSRKEELSTIVTTRNQEQEMLQKEADSNAEKLSELSWQNHRNATLLQRLAEQRGQSGLLLKQAGSLAEATSARQQILANETQAQVPLLQSMSGSLNELATEIGQLQEQERICSTEILHHNRSITVLEDSVREKQEQLHRFAGYARGVQENILRSERVRGDLAGSLQMLRQQANALSGQLADIDDSSCAIL